MMAAEGQMTSTGPSANDLGRSVSAAELDGKQMLAQIFGASVVPFETASRMRRHFRIGQRYCALVTSG
jgi:hypothetical protein